MTEALPSANAGPPPAAPAAPVRVFLVVVDDSQELRLALAYASERARRCGGRVALLYVIEPTEFQNWRAVEDLMREERRLEAERLILRYAKDVAARAGTLPALYLREGDRRDELLKLIDEDRSISILVLAAGTGPEGPGPLLSHLATSGFNRLRIPLTIVPGGLTEAEVTAVS